MTTEQLQEFARLTSDASQAVGRLRALARIDATTDLEPLRTLLEDLQWRTSALAIWIDEERWRPIWKEKPAPVTSSAIEHGVHVRRFTPGGVPLTEVNSPPPHRIGRWRQGLLGKPRKRRTEDV